MGEGTTSFLAADVSTAGFKISFIRIPFFVIDDLNLRSRCPRHQSIAALQWRHFPGAAGCAAQIRWWPMRYSGSYNSRPVLAASAVVCLAHNGLTRRCYEIGATSRF
ncbi:hypothetical protein HYPGJ_20087 [Hyphomicrobium sp. GJ21]|nr:hypothetical protein HYPGJ_20087 [Hyphomicrobium sp. GJ21]